MTRDYLFLPILHLGHRRWRVRMRLIRRLAFWAVRDHYPEGDVLRVWIGPLLIVAMIDGGNR